MSTLAVSFAAALFGAAFQELVWWYDRRDRLSARKYQVYLHSRLYWTVTILMLLLSPIGCIFWKWRALSNYEPIDFVIFGAAFPLIFKGALNNVGIAAKGRELGKTVSEYSAMDVLGWYFGWS